NCGGVSPGWSFSGVGWWGWGPVSAVEPSPMSCTVAPLALALALAVPGVRPGALPGVPVGSPPAVGVAMFAHPAVAPSAAAETAAASTDLRDTESIVSPCCRCPGTGRASDEETA